MSEGWDIEGARDVSNIVAVGGAPRYRLVYTISYPLLMFIAYTLVFFQYCKHRDNVFNSPFALTTLESIEVYRYYTYSYLHYDLLHYASNMYVWLILSSMVSYDSGFIRTFAMHTTAIVGGAFGVGWEARIKKTNINVVGASGGMYGMLSSIFGDLVLNWNEMDRIKRIVYTGILTETILSEIITNTVYYNPMISCSDHFGGFIYGIFGGLIFSKNINLKKWEKKMQIGIGTCITTVTIVNFVNFILLQNR